MKPFLRILFLLGVGFLSLGTVVKKKGAVLMTQTDPVGYQEKLKEEEGGKKGPPAPTIEFFPKERFLTEGPVEKGKEEGTPPEKVQAEEEGGLAEEEGELSEEELKLEDETDDTFDASEETWDFDDNGDTEDPLP